MKKHHQNTFFQNTNMGVGVWPVAAVFYSIKCIQKSVKKKKNLQAAERESAFIYPDIISHSSWKLINGPMDLDVQGMKNSYIKT